jgi:hypothetical protein
MLRIKGTVLDVTSETIQGPTGSFISTTVHMLSGLNVERVRVGRDFPANSTPKKGDEVELEVVIQAYAGKNGAGYRLTALNRVYADSKAAA